MQKKVYIHAAICSELNALYERKNHDYGDSFSRNYEEFGIVYPLIHLQEKLDRLKSLRKNVAMVEEESIEDTLLDLSNYAIMTVVERRKNDKTFSTDMSCSRCRHHSDFKNPTETCKTCTDKSNWEERG